MSAKIQGVKNFDNARRGDFVKIYHALEKICVAPQMPPPEIPRPSAATFGN